MTAAVVLAAGLSRRMGDADKLLLPFGGAPLYRRALLLAASLDAGARLVVTNRPEIAAEARAMGFAVVPSPRAGEGMGCSVAAGAAALAATIARAAFLNADQPFLRVETVDALVRLSAQTDGIAVPRVEGQPCSPCVFPRRFFGELAALTGETGGRAVWKRHAEDVRFYDAPDAAEFDDVDTPEAYARLKGRALDFFARL